MVPEKAEKLKNMAINKILLNIEFIRMLLFKSCRFIPTKYKKLILLTIKTSLTINSNILRQWSCHNKFNLRLAILLITSKKRKISSTCFL